jgi:predicted HD phosphohydrolase
MTEIAAGAGIRSFARMDESTAEQWAVIAEETARDEVTIAPRVLMLLSMLADITEGFAVDQLTHSLQTADRARVAGADDELVVASLCHDVGKVISTTNHPAVAAEILRPFVRPDVVGVIASHQDFQGRHYYGYFGGDPDARDRYRDQPWYELAELFADQWDQTSFDPAYPTPPLSEFEGLVRGIFAKPRF